MTIPADRGGRRRPDPFSSAVAKSNSRYAAFENGRLARLLHPGQTPTAIEEQVHTSFREMVLEPSYSCLGARAVVNRRTYRVGVYGNLGAPESGPGLAHDLFEFGEEQGTLGDGFTTYVAAFTRPTDPDEKEFERLFWAQLQSLHEQDRVHHGWDPAVSSDPDDKQFSFSFAGRAFFVVGLHPHSSRLARRFAWPALVFNAHHQFERLRQQGRFFRMQKLIRSRELALQGNLNPNLSDFGDFSAARQYSGRAVEDGWRCPFQPRPREAGGA